MSVAEILNGDTTTFCVPAADAAGWYSARANAVFPVTMASTDAGLPCGALQIGAAGKESTLHDVLASSTTDSHLAGSALTTFSCLKIDRWSNGRSATLAQSHFV